MTLEFIINNVPGHSIVEAVANPNIERTVIEVYEHGHKINTLPYTRHMRFLPGLKPHPKYFVSDELRTLEGKVTLHRAVTSGHLAMTINPFYQIIYSDLSDISGLTDEGIYGRLTKDHRILPDTRMAWKVTKNLLFDMQKKLHIVHYKDKGKYHYTIGKKLVSPAGGYQLLEFKNGYDPIAWQIMKVIKSYGTIPHEEIISYLIINVGWLEKIRTIDNYLMQLSEGVLWDYPVCKEKGKGNIVEIKENQWKYEYPLEPFGEKVL